MHEMSITMDILDIVRDVMKKNAVKNLKSLKVSVGEMTAVEPDALRFCFDACIKDTPLAGATLEILEIPLMGRCSVCGSEFKLEQYFTTPCPECGNRKSDMISGKELKIISMETG